MLVNNSELEAAVVRPILVVRRKGGEQLFGFIKGSLVVLGGYASPQLYGEMSGEYSKRKLKEEEEEKKKEMKKEDLTEGSFDHFSIYKNFSSNPLELLKRAVLINVPLTIAAGYFSACIRRISK